MKLKLLLLSILVLSVPVQVLAAVSVDRTLSKDYLKNNGYSKQVYDTVNVSRARALGEPYYSQEEIDRYNSDFGRQVLRKLREYLDPAMEDYSFYHHDNNPEPGFSDL